MALSWKGSWVSVPSWVRIPHPPRKNKVGWLSGRRRWFRKPERELGCLRGFDPHTHCSGRLAEWPKALALKAREVRKGLRGFDPHIVRDVIWRRDSRQLLYGASGEPGQSLKEPIRDPYTDTSSGGRVSDSISHHPRKKTWAGSQVGEGNWLITSDAEVQVLLGPRGVRHLW